VLVDGTETLERLSQVPIFTWNAREQDPLVRHIGPMAQDFYATFEVGQDGRHIATIDLDGVALAAIQGLYQLLQEKDAQIVAQQDQIDDLEARVTALEEAAGATTQSCSRWSDFLPGGNVLLLGLSLVWAIRQSGILKPSVERPPTVAYPSQTAAFSSRRASRVTHLLGRLRFSSGQVRETEPHSHCPRSF
jgi:hypothetical protein